MLDVAVPEVGMVQLKVEFFSKMFSKVFRCASSSALAIFLFSFTITLDCERMRAHLVKGNLWFCSLSRTSHSCVAATPATTSRRRESAENFSTGGTNFHVTGMVSQ